MDRHTRQGEFKTGKEMRVRLNQAAPKAPAAETETSCDNS
jgi:hypothetical protein